MGFVRPPHRAAPSASTGVLMIALLLLASPAGAAPDEAARVEILQARGAHALRTGDASKAVEHLEEALEIAPDQPETLALYARALLEAGRPAEAQEVTERLRTLQPGDADVLFLMAVTAYRQQDWIAAKRFLEEARAREPGDARVRLYLGRAYQELGEDRNAEQELMEAARLDPEFQGPAAYRLGILSLQRNRVAEARDFFEEVQSIDPDSELAQSAELYLRLIAESQPRRFSYWGRLGLAYDSNITLAGGDDLVEQSREDGIRGSLEIGLNALLVDEKPWSVRAGFTNYVSYHDREHDFDIQQVRPWLLTTYRFGEILALDARFTYEQVWRNYHHFKTAYVAQPAVRFTPAAGWLTRLSWEYEDRNYHDAFELIPTRDRDGQVRTLGLDQYVPLPNPVTDGIAYLRFGWRWRIEASNGHQFDSRSHKPLLTLGMALPWGMDLTFDASYEKRKFTRVSTFDAIRDIRFLTGVGPTGALPAFAAQPASCRFAFPAGEDFSLCPSGKRLDKITQTRLRLRKNIGRSWTIESYYRWVHWKSTTQEFDFTRHIVGLAATFRR